MLIIFPGSRKVDTEGEGLGFCPSFQRLSTLAKQAISSNNEAAKPNIYVQLVEVPQRDSLYNEIY